MSTAYLASKEMRMTPDGLVKVSFYNTQDQGKLPYPYQLSDWPEEARRGIMEAMQIIENSVVLERPMQVGFIWTADLSKNNYLAATYNSFISIKGIGGISHLDDRFRYPSELIHQLTGQEKYAGVNTIIAFNSEKDWCLNSSSDPVWYEQDLITVALHEISHGLGISSSFTKNSVNQPYIYDKYLRYDDGEPLVYHYSALKNSVGTALANIDIYYEGEAGMRANNNEPIKLHVPATFSAASICHFSSEYAHNEDGELLIAGTAYGKSSRHLGGFVTGILKDIGWKIHPAADYDLVPNTGIYQAQYSLRGYNGRIFIEIQGGERKEVVITTITGKIIAREWVTGSVSFPVQPNNVYIVRIGNKTEKIIS